VASSDGESLNVLSDSPPSLGASSREAPSPLDASPLLVPGAPPSAPLLLPELLLPELLLPELLLPELLLPELLLPELLLPELLLPELLLDDPASPETSSGPGESLQAHTVSASPPYATVAARRIQLRIRNRSTSFIATPCRSD
jgi:hypothetical protein